MAVSRLRFYVNQTSATGTFYIDLAKALSIQERKLHRQKKVYTVYGGYYVDSNGSRINLNVAPNTWVTKRAVNRAFNVWRKNVAMTLEKSGASASAKYSDFKVYLDNQMGTSSLLPTDASNNVLQAGEWDYTTLASADPDPAGNANDQFDVQIVGPHSGADPNWSRISALKSWLDSRPVPSSLNQPNVTNDYDTDPLSNLHDSADVDDTRLELIRNEGNQAPYDEDQFFGLEQAAGNSNNLMRVSSAFTSAANPVVPIHGFNAICGLIQVTTSSSPGEWELVLDVETQGESF